MPRLFVALPVPEEVLADLTALQSGVPDARWVPPENFHVTLCFAGEVQGAVMRDFEEELGDISGPRFSVTLSGVEQFSSGKQPKATGCSRRCRPSRATAASRSSAASSVRT
jgi:RNA 2',3'-cyclic 3'-phosphodiesterase